MVSYRQVLRAVIVVTVLVICYQLALYDGTSSDDADGHHHHARRRNPGVGRSSGKSMISDQNHEEDDERHDSPLSSSEHLAQNAEHGSGGADRPPRIHFITVQTSVSPGWCRNMRSALRSGISVSNLGWGQSYKHTYRPKWIMRFLKEEARVPGGIHEDDVVLFSDGADTMFTGVGPETILERYERIAREDYGKRDFVLYSAEANCFHQQLFDGPWGVKKGRCIAAYKRFDPSIHTKWRYLNAGTWIGTVRAALWLFGNVTKILDADRSLWCDQSVIGGLMLRGPSSDNTNNNEQRKSGSSSTTSSRRLIMLDTKNSIFLPTYHLRVKTDVCPGAASDEVFAEPESLVLCHGRRAPAVLHFNGKSGTAGVEAERRVRMSNNEASIRKANKKKRGSHVYDALSEEDANLVLWDTKGASIVRKSFRDMCPKFS